MSDTGSPLNGPTLPADRPVGPGSRGPKIAARCCLVLLSALVACVGYLVYAQAAIRAQTPMEFAPFKYRPLEKSFLTAKFDLNELPSKLLSGGPVEITLNEREVNALLFGEAKHTQEGEKARVLIEGNALRLEFSRPIHDRPETEFYNVSALFRCSVGPEVITLQLLEGQIGDYSLGPISRPIVEELIRKALNERYQRDSKFNRVRAMTIRDGNVRLTYEPN